ncbi:MAG TPA: enoyl-CoA hydratase/isomerase family protein [Micromonosporaceae bacterium]
MEIEGPVATVTLCRPDVLNAQTPAMWAALRTIGRELPGDIRVVVVRGEGRSFSAGLDLTIAQAGASTDGSFADLVALPPTAAADRIAGYQEAFSWLTRADIVSIAAVQGHAIGAGFQLALACDLRVLASDAKFTMGEIRIGLVPDLGGTRPLVELVGYSRAFEICATGRRIAADEALALGLANLVVPPDDLDRAVRDLTAALLAGARDAVVETKALLRGAIGRTPDEQRRYEREAQVRRVRDLAGLGE